ncbi:uncharacterized protein LOC111831459 [Capsella rubella]|uniref:uncharacterized protein LOC111831459 n=1 Tax=Capsella rubella TaxID=81985 RepID=UPI000CD514DE|nr:uncharacterized protein LOC111831459 [Capsella rubella]
MSPQLGPVDSRPNEELDEEPLTNDSTFNERIEEEVRQMDLPAPVETTERPQTGEVEGNTTAPRRSEGKPTNEPQLAQVAPAGPPVQQTVSMDDLRIVFGSMTKDIYDRIAAADHRMDTIMRNRTPESNGQDVSLDALAPGPVGGCTLRPPVSVGRSCVRPTPTGTRPQALVTASSQPADAPSSGRNRDLEDLYARIADINSQVHRVSSSAPEIDRMFEETQRTPFTSRITQARIPHIKFKLPTYDGDKDPRTFMTAFMAAVTKAHFSDEEKDTGHCQLFVESLTGNALTWFSRLSPNSIDNFAQLSTSFLRHYRHFIQPGASSIDLWDTTQEAGETLQQYLVRFKNLLAKVSVPEDAALAAFRKGLIPGSSLRKDLAIREPKDLDDALHRASRYALFEEEDAKLAAKSGANRPTPRDRKREDYREPRKHYEGKDASRGAISAISKEASNQNTSSKEA